MRKFKTVLTLCVLFQLATAMGAERATDFSGSWIATTGTSPQGMKIAQSASTLTLDLIVGDRTVRTTTWTFGAPTTIEAGGGLFTPSTTTALPMGHGLEFVGTVTLANGTSADVRETWSLDESGRLLTIARLITVAPGTTLDRTQTFRRAN